MPRLQQSEYLGTIPNSTNHLLRVVNDILDLSKVEAGKLELKVVDFSLSEVIDDVREFLQRAGYQVILANNGAEALDAIDAAPYLAVLMDVRMPVMDGYEAIARIRDLPDYVDMPVIALSAGVLNSEVERALAAGVDHYLSKPIDFDALLGLLDDLRATRAETSVVQIAAPPPPPEDTDGIDFRLALRNHDGDDKLLKRLLSDFVRLYEDAPETLQRHLGEGDLDAAERLAHNVAGVAGSFGAMTLMQIARDVEHLIQDEAEDLDEAANAFRLEVRRFVAAIGKFADESASLGVGAD